MEAVWSTASLCLWYEGLRSGMPIKQTEANFTAVVPAPRGKPWTSMLPSNYSQDTMSGNKLVLVDEWPPGTSLISSVKCQSEHQDCQNRLVMP